MAIVCSSIMAIVSSDNIAKVASSIVAVLYSRTMLIVCSSIMAIYLIVKAHLASLKWAATKELPQRTCTLTKAVRSSTMQASSEPWYFMKTLDDTMLLHFHTSHQSNVALQTLRS